MSSIHWFSKPFVMFNRVSDPKEKKHPHGVVGRIGNDYVSLNITHAPVVKGKPTVKLGKNPEDAYVVSQDVYQLPASSYSHPYRGTWSGFSQEDIKKIQEMVKNAKSFVK